MEKKLSYLSLEPHLKRLRITGIYPLHRDTPKLYQFLHTIWMRVSLFVTPLYVVQQTIQVYQIRHDAPKVMEIMMLLLTNSDAIYKQNVFCMKVGRIDELIDIMKGPIFNQDVNEHTPLLASNVRFSRLFLTMFNGAALSTCVLWTLFPTILFLQDKPEEFAVWFPFDSNSSPYFYVAVVYVWMQTSWLAFNNTTMDAFISFCLAQSKTQLSILRLDLGKLVEKSKEEAKLFSISYADVVQRRFTEILLHYNEIVNFTENLQRIFSGALLYQFMVSGWIICLTAYRTLTISPFSVEFAAMILYMGCIVAELFLFCNFGHAVNWESALVLESAYSMEWLEFPAKLRKDLIIFMERLKRPLAPKAGDFIPLANSTFVSIMRSSYSFYVLLQNTN